MIPLDELLRMAETQARTILIGTKEELIPSWLLVSGKEVAIIGTPWHGDFEKRIMIDNMRHLMRERQAEAYSLVVEAWFVTEAAKDVKVKRPPLPGLGGPLYENLRGDDRRPSERPDRKEAVCAMCATKRETRFRQWEIIRDAKGRCTDLKLITGVEDVVTSIFDNLLNDEGPGTLQ